MSERIDNLKLLVERQHKCRATHVTSAPIKERLEGKGKVVWAGVVETFQLEGHPTAKRAYAWARPPSREHPEPEYTVVLGIPPVNSARDAVKVAVVNHIRNLLHQAEELAAKKASGQK